MSMHICHKLIRLSHVTTATAVIQLVEVIQEECGVRMSMQSSLWLVGWLTYLSYFLQLYFAGQGSNLRTKKKMIPVASRTEDLNI